MAKAKSKRAKKAASNNALLAILAVGYRRDDGSLIVGVSTPQTCGKVNKQQAIRDALDHGYDDDGDSFVLDRVIEVRGADKKKAPEVQVPTEVVTLK